MRGGTIRVPGAGGRIRGRHRSLAGAGHRGEQPGQTLFGLEHELERDILRGVVIVVDVNLVNDAGVEGEEVRAVGGFKKRINAEDQGELLRRGSGGLSGLVTDETHRGP